MFRRSVALLIPRPTLILTEACNLRCPYCYVPKTGRRMTEETALRAVDFLLDRAPPPSRLSLSSFGGEPFLAQDRMLRRAGLLVEQVYGDLSQSRFSWESSFNQVYLCRKPPPPRGLRPRLGTGPRKFGTRCPPTSAADPGSSGFPRSALGKILRRIP